MARFYNSKDGKEQKANPGAPGDVYSSEFAGMPTGSVMKQYPESKYNIDGYEDTIQGIDFFAEQNHRQLMKQKRTKQDR